MQFHSHQGVEREVVAMSVGSHRQSRENRRKRILAETEIPVETEKSGTQKPEGEKNDE